MSVRRPAPGALSQTATSTSRSPDEELYELWFSVVIEWSKLILDRASPPTLPDLQTKHDNMEGLENLIMHTVRERIKRSDFMRSAQSSVQSKQPDLKKGAEWLIETINYHRELRRVALLHRKLVDQGIGDMQKAKEQLAKTIPWKELRARRLVSRTPC